jgi:hypothetical protein
MSYPQVINEVAGAINAVISVIASSVFKVLPVLLVLLMVMAAIDVFVGTLFEGEARTETPFVSGNPRAEIHLSSNVTQKQ